MFKEQEWLYFHKLEGTLYYLEKKKKSFSVFKNTPTCKVHSCDLSFSLQEIHTFSMKNVYFYLWVILPNPEVVLPFLLASLSVIKILIRLSKWGLILPLLLNLIYSIPISSQLTENTRCFFCGPQTQGIPTWERSLKQCTC